MTIPLLHCYRGISAGTGTNIQAHMVGHPAYSFYVYQQVYDVNGDPIEGQFVDRNGDGQITEADKYIYHSRDPKVVFTWNNTFNYKNWDFGMVLRANIGNWVYNDFEAANTSISLTSSAPLSNLMSNRFLFNDLECAACRATTSLRNASFLRCDNITIGYILAQPAQRRTFVAPLRSGSESLRDHQVQRP